ncbi:hypothetical protein GH714_029197 [Hevea brasiliensis]|uniref:Malectin-like domain-containing protein n=1 Tax=Hevea brasiliensis TaxID=3981 RepID=A0A6A6KUY2_HEVBR|nr:hypothetical protein GH714_029197 [Hevea brasiliensis]
MCSDLFPPIEFISIDCGSTSNYTDPRTGLEWISDNGIMNHGKPVEVKNPNGKWVQYRRRRDFPIDSKKYCYNLSTKERRRYIVRATFQYGRLENEDSFPKFELYLDATKWSTVTILDASRIYVEEMIIRAPSSSIDVCICCATTGSPFISTVELRPLNLSMYATDYEDSFFLKLAARVNFGAPTEDALRYPDDPYDRIWDSDLVKRQNFLVGMAPGTVGINTSYRKNIDIQTREYPPVKVMQTAVVGKEGTLSYRLNLEDFPANARAYAYFAEIEDLGANETRKFKLIMHPDMSDYSNAVVNIAENANGSYRLYEPSYMNVSLDFVLSFSFVKTRDSTQGPLLNAIEISKYLKIESKTESQDVAVLNFLRSMSAGSSWTNEGGDPCVPAQWEWVTCSSTSPPRITKIALSGKNLKGEIPSEINNMEELTELWLDGNSLTGPLPDISHLVKLKIVYIQNNSFSGKIPQALLTGKVIFSLVHLRNLQKKTSHQKSNNHGSSLRTGIKPSTAYSISRENWKGSFGTVYYGQMKDGKEVAVKIMADSSSHLTQQFVTEARALIRKGDVVSIVDPVLIGNAKIESIWRIAEVAIQCVQQRAVSRPKMQEVILAIQEGIKIEKGDGAHKLSGSGSSKAQSSRKTLLTSFLEIESPHLSNDCLAPAAR